MNEPRLEVKNLFIKFGDEAVLEDVSFPIHSGECVAITGPNGSGKSTFLRTLSGFIQPVSGKIIFSGTDITHYPAWKRARMGLVHVLEGARLFSSLTVKENLTVAISNDEKNKLVNIDRLKDLAPIFTDPLFFKQTAATLSGGERMMVAIARAVVQNPIILLLDSPFMGSGPNFRIHTAEIIKYLTKKQNVGVVLVDHNIPSVKNVANSILSINNKTLAQNNTFTK